MSVLTFPASIYPLWDKQPSVLKETKETLTKTPKPTREAMRLKTRAIFLNQAKILVGSGVVHDISTAKALTTAKWNETVDKYYLFPKSKKDLHTALNGDSFALMIAHGLMVDELFQARLQDSFKDCNQFLNQLSFNQPTSRVIDIVDAPNASKQFKSSGCILKDTETYMQLAAQETDLTERRAKVMDILSHETAYYHGKDMDIQLPSLVDSKKGMVFYHFDQQLIGNGIKAWKGTTDDPNEYPIYLFQGTTTNPKLYQGSFEKMVADLEKGGPGFQTFLKYSSTIESTLKELAKKDGMLPLVAGHSLGGSMTLYTGMFMHDLVTEAQAFNPPGIQENVHYVWENMCPADQGKILNYQVDGDFSLLFGPYLPGKIIMNYSLSTLSSGGAHSHKTTFDDTRVVVKNVDAAVNTDRKLTAHDNRFAIFVCLQAFLGLLAWLSNFFYLSPADQKKLAENRIENLKLGFEQQKNKYYESRVKDFESSKPALQRQVHTDGPFGVMTWQTQAQARFKPTADFFIGVTDKLRAELKKEIAAYRKQFDANAYTQLSKDMDTFENHFGVRTLKKIQQRCIDFTQYDSFEAQMHERYHITHHAADSTTQTCDITTANHLAKFKTINTWANAVLREKQNASHPTYT